MSGQPNPVREWLCRVAQECGNPEKMETWACCMSSSNTKQLMMDYARSWRDLLVGHVGKDKP